MAKHYVQSFERGRWCVDHAPVDVNPGDVVGFTHPDDAEHFIELKRAGYIGQFATLDLALERLEAILAKHRETTAAAEAEAAAAAEAEAAAAAEVDKSAAETVADTPAPAKSRKVR